MNSTVIETPNRKPWLVTFTASLFLFYEFIQMNMFNAINGALSKEFLLSSTEISNISAYYFHANVLFLLIAGSVLDRFSPRRIIISSLSLCVLGTFLFALSTNATWLIIFRFITGIGSAFCFLSCIRLASRWFPPARMALVSGLIVTMAMLGGAVAQTPLTLLTEWFGWRYAIAIDGVFGIFVLLAIIVVVRDHPENNRDEYQRVQSQLKDIRLPVRIRLSFLRLRNWFYGIYTSLLNIPIFILGGLWGTRYLEEVHHIPSAKGSLITSMLFVGAIIGSPLMGFISDHIGRRKLPMLIGATLSFGVIMTIIFQHDASFVGLLFLFFLLGLFTSTQVLSYPCMVEISPSALTATCVSIISISAIAGGSFLEPLYGWLMDLGWQGEIVNGLHQYDTASFRYAMWLFPVGFAISFVMALLTKETYCQHIEQT